MDERKKYPFWKMFLFSFFSKDLYRETGSKGSGTAWGYLFLLLVLLAAPLAVLFQEWAGRVLPEMAAKIPDFKIDKGEFSSPVAQPYRVDFGGDSALVFDTTGLFKLLDQIPDAAGLQTLFLVTKTGFQERQISAGLAHDQQRDFTNAPSMTVTQSRLQQQAAFAVRWSGSAAYFFIAGGWFCLEAMFILIYALVGLAAAWVFKRALDYDGSLRLSVISHTPALILVTGLTLAGWDDFLLSISILVSTGYLFFAVACQPKAVLKGNSALSQSTYHT